MKNVFIMQKSLVFRMNVEKLFNPTEYTLFLIINPEIFPLLTATKQDRYFKKIFILNDFTFENAKNSIDEVISTETGSPVDIITNCERCVNICGKLRTHYALRDMDETMANHFTNKIIMKNTLQKHQVRLPRYVSFDPTAYEKNKLDYQRTLINNLGLPMFAKPIDDASSHGAEKLETVSALTRWLEIHATQKKLELDEYIEGTLYHCDAFIQHGKILYTQISEYLSPVFEFFQGIPVGSITLPASHADFKSLEIYNEKILRLLGYKGSGITHLEVFKNKKGEFIFLEIGARAGGAYLPKLYKKYLNLDFYETHLLLQLNKNLKLDFSPTAPYYACVWFPFEDTTTVGFNSPTLQSPHEITRYTFIGEKTTKNLSLSQKSTEIFLWNKNFETLYQDFISLKKFKPIVGEANHNSPNLGGKNITS